MIRVPFAPTPGLVTDETDFSVPNRCVDMANARWRAGKPEPDGGYVKYLSDQLNGVCRAVMAWNDLDSRLNIAFGTNTKLYVHVGGALNDITPVGLTPGSVDGALPGTWGAGDWGDGYWGEGSVSSAFLRTWSLDTWGEQLVANPRGGAIYLWTNNPANPAAVLANAPDEVNSILVTPERQILAIGTSEEISGVFNPMAVRGCASENNTVWTTLASNNAFEDTLSGAGSRLVTGLMVGTYPALWTDEGLFMGTFVGTTEQTYQWDLQGTSCGLIGPNAVIVVNKRAYWITPDLQFYTWAPGESPSSIECPIRGEFMANLVRAQADKIAGTAIGQFGELTWFYPDSQDGNENSRFIRFTTDVPYGQGYQWSKGVLARTAVMDAGAVKQPVFVSPNGWVFSHEDGQTADGGPLKGFYKVSLPNIDEGGQFVMVDGIECDFKDQAGAITLELTLRKFPQSTVRTGYKAITIAPGIEKKNFQCQGRCGEVSVSWESSPAFHRLGKPVFTATPTALE